MSYGSLAQKAKNAGEKPPQRSLRSRKAATPAPEVKQKGPSDVTKVPATPDRRSTASKTSARNKTTPPKAASSTSVTRSAVPRQTAESSIAVVETVQDRVPLEKAPAAPKAPKGAPAKEAPAKRGRGGARGRGRGKRGRGGSSRSEHTDAEYSGWCTGPPDEYTAAGYAITGSTTNWTGGMPFTVDMTSWMWDAEDAEAKAKEAEETNAAAAAAESEVVVCAAMARRNDRSRKGVVQLYKALPIPAPPLFGEGTVARKSIKQLKEVEKTKTDTGASGSAGPKGATNGVTGQQGNTEHEKAGVTDNKSTRIHDDAEKGGTNRRGVQDNSAKTTSEKLLATDPAMKRKRSSSDDETGAATMGKKHKTIKERGVIEADVNKMNKNGTGNSNDGTHPTAPTTAVKNTIKRKRGTKENDSDGEKGPEKKKTVPRKGINASHGSNVDPNEVAANDQQEPQVRSRPVRQTRQPVHLRPPSRDAALRRQALRCASPPREVDIFDGQAPTPFVSRSEALGGPSAATGGTIRRGEGLQEEGGEWNLEEAVEVLLREMDRVTERRWGTRGGSGRQ